MTVISDEEVLQWKDALTSLSPYWVNDEITLAGLSLRDQRIFEILLDCRLDVVEFYKDLWGFAIRPFINTPARNHWNLRKKSSVSVCVLHATTTSLLQTLRWFTADINQGRVSAHYVISCDEIIEFPLWEDGRKVVKKVKIQGGIAFAVVPEAFRAWHAGPSHWKRMKNLNDHSIGIELVNLTHDEVVDKEGECKMRIYHRYDSSEQMKALILLLKGIATRYRLKPQQVVTHADIAPDFAQDPYPLFPFNRLYHCGWGMGLDPESSSKISQGGADFRQFWRHLHSLGYPSSDLLVKKTKNSLRPLTREEAKKQLIMTFQMHFTCDSNPELVTGRLTANDVWVARKLAEKYETKSLFQDNFLWIFVSLVGLCLASLILYIFVHPRRGR